MGNITIKHTDRNDNANYNASIETSKRATQLNYHCNTPHKKRERHEKRLQRTLHNISKELRHMGSKIMKHIERNDNANYQANIETAK